MKADLIAAFWMAVGGCLGWIARTAFGAHEDVGVNLSKFRKARRARRKYGLRSLALAALIVLVLIAMAQGG